MIIILPGKINRGDWMATQEQINELMLLFHAVQPPQNNHAASRNDQEGMLGVLIYLNRTNGTVTAGMISKAMHITTGRVSVLIRKMSDKGLIIRQRGKNDARVTEIRMTEKGQHIIDDLNAQRKAQMAQLIDTLGMDQLKEYISLSQKVWQILTPLTVDL